MKLLAAGCSVLMWLSLPAHVTGADRRVSTMIPHGNERKVIQCRVAPGKLSLLESGRTFFFDYTARRLIVTSTESGRRCYPFFSRAAANQEELVFRERSKMMGEMRVFPQMEAGGTRLTKILFGPRAATSLMMVEPSLDRFGMRIVPEMVQVTALRDHPLLAVLEKMAAANAALYDADPLLRRLDIIGLIPVAGGVVESVQAGPRTVRYEYQLAAEDQAAP